MIALILKGHEVVAKVMIKLSKLRKNLMVWIMEIMFSIYNCSTIFLR